MKQEKDSKTLTIEVWDFWKLMQQIDILTDMAKILSCKIRLIYHGKAERTEALKLSILEQILQQSGQPFELQMLMTQEAVGGRKSVPAQGFKCY